MNARVTCRACGNRSEHTAGTHRCACGASIRVTRMGDIGFQYEVHGRTQKAPFTVTDGRVERRNG